MDHSRTKLLFKMALKKYEDSKENEEYKTCVGIELSENHHDGSLGEPSISSDVRCLSRGEENKETENIKEHSVLIQDSLRWSKHDYSEKDNSDEPYQSSGSEYVPNSEDTDSAEEGVDPEISNMEVNRNVDENEGRKKRGRKRKIVNQSRRDRKRLSNFNMEYISARNKTVTPKKFNDGYSCTCLRKCAEIVDVDLRRQFFDQFWNMGSYEGRCAFLGKCVKEFKKKRCYTISKVSRRDKSRNYFIKDIQVCKNFFINTLQINNNRIRVALHKLENSNIILDERGRSSGGRNAIEEKRIEDIKQHISSFPKYVSHYCRSQTDSKFLHPDLNLSKMYKLYADSTEQPVSLTKYKNVFYSHFNLRFKTPHKDTCRLCDTYIAASSSAQGTERVVLDANHQSHLQIAEELRNQMKNDLKAAQSDETLETLTFDLQKTLPMPKLPTGILYYKRQLNLFNLGICIGSTKKGVFNVWLEYEAGRGTQEVGSCLRKYINDNIQAPVKKLILWSDSCGGQNRSIKLVLMLIHVLQNHPSLETITLNFLLSGHSFLPNDSHFGDVECALNAQQRLYSDSDYIQVMKSCRKKNKFIVNRMTSSDMVSVSLLEKSITNRKVDSANKESVSWLKTHVITMKKEEPTTLYMKNHVTDLTYSNINIEKVGKGRKPIIGQIELPPLWPNGRPISEKKMKNLKEILYLVPKDAKPFYNFLRNVEIEDFEEDVEGVGPVPDFEIDEEQLGAANT